MTELDDSLKVPTADLTVEIALEGREPRRVHVPLPAEPKDAPPQDALRLRLEETEGFFPVQDAEEDRWLLLRKEAIRWVAIERDDDEMQLDLDLYDVRSAVRVELSCGTALEGELLYSAPTTRARVMDHLNESGSYICLYQLDRILLVGTAHVVSVVERRRS